jgi:hypothetical protein
MRRVLCVQMLLHLRDVYMYECTHKVFFEIDRGAALRVAHGIVQ